MYILNERNEWWVGEWACGGWQAWLALLCCLAGLCRLAVLCCALCLFRACLLIGIINIAINDFAKI